LDQAPSTQEDGPSLVHAIWRHWRLVALTMLIGGLAAFTWSSLLPDRYQAVARIFLDNDDKAPDPGRVVRSQAELLASPTVLDRVVDAAGGGLTRRDLEERLRIEPAQDADLITVRVLDRTPRGAARLADLVVATYRQVVAGQTQETARQTAATLQRGQARLESDIARLKDQLRDDPDNPRFQAILEAKARQMQTLADQAEQAKFEAAQAARAATPPPNTDIPDEPTQPHPRRTAALGALLGLVVGVGLAWWLTTHPPAATPTPALEAPARIQGQLRRLYHRLVPTANGAPAVSAYQTQDGIVDFSRLTTSIQQVLDSLDGPWEHLYDRDIPQMSTDEVAGRFPVDFVVLLLDDGQGLQLKGRVGLSPNPPPTGRRHDRELSDKLLGGGPRLATDGERGRLDDAGVPGGEAETLALVPLVHDEVAFGMVLAGQWSTNGQAPTLDDRHVQDIATCVQQLTPYLWAWLRLRHLKLRLRTLR
jgi:hypothetical protein